MDDDDRATSRAADPLPEEADGIGEEGAKILLEDSEARQAGRLPTPPTEKRTSAQATAT